MEENEILTLSPYDNFIYALKAETTKRQYPNRLDRFLCFIGFVGSIQEKCDKLYELDHDKELFQSHLIRFINFQKRRIEFMAEICQVLTTLFVLDTWFSRLG